MSARKYDWLPAAGISIGLLFAWFEVAALRNSEQNWQALFAPAGTAALAAYALIFSAGLYLCFGGWLPRATALPVWISWSAAGSLILLAAWIQLYSPWQAALPGPWTQLVFAAALARALAQLLAPRPIQFGWGDLALTLALFLIPRVVQELRAFSGHSGLSRLAAGLGILTLMALTFLLYHPLGEQVRRALLGWRARLTIRWPLAWVVSLVPFVYCLAVGTENYILLFNTRFLVLLAALWFAAYLTCGRPERLVSADSLGINLGLLTLASAILARLLLVVDYPFSLTWSEGNRFYDYSLVFAQSLYDLAGGETIAYTAPGRFGLWGILFLWHGLPIWVHRLWDLILQSAPPVMLGFLLTRKIQPAALRYGAALWIGIFFIALAPLHPPFMLASVLVVLVAFEKSPWIRGASLAIASVYVGLTRPTWVFAPGVMGALIDLFLYYPHRRGNWLRRLVPTALLTAAGVLPGLIRDFDFLASTAAGGTLTTQQPLLWNRLLPNDTLGAGVLLLTLLYTGPLLILLAWWLIVRRADTDWIQKTAVVGALAGFFAAGLVISTKIGGGGDLHNLDMYLVTLVLIVALALTAFPRRLQDTQWPAWATGLVVCLALFPFFPFTPLDPGAAHNGRLDLPPAAHADATLNVIREQVDRALETGPVLFMDQRQLLTFGYVPAVPFIPEYEKKQMMDQALASNRAYFQPYYNDLAEQRFALIVTEPLRTRLKGSGVFSEENDLWVVWVSRPTLCYYEPIFTDAETNVQLLAPRTGPVDCRKFIE